ncbi:hypothetical protein N5T57_09510 [Aliarcobacter cryaerophilus]|uniref:tyrosine-type recombinase/integrase n=1 Tax=Aliarcobacter cryaerophilus TaxID=28198 RepID=UPI0021B2543B|nr:tyrosine-type recombinase/integrase [Aliarcobacter cryaerophilus]MCT7523160.1 hypothetical protein [Aliarcobacter cryaerophilus]
MNNDFYNCKLITKDKIIFYINSSLDNQIIKDLKLSIINLIFDNLEEHDNFIRNNIYFDMKLWLKLYKKDLFKKHSLVIHNFVNELISKSFVLKKSRIYPKNQYVYSVNPLNLAFLYANLSDYERIIKLRDFLVEKLQNPMLNNDKEKSDFKINLFIYLKLFVINKISNTYFQYLKKENIIYTKKKVIFVVKEEDEKGFIPLHTIIFDEFTSNIIKKVFQEYLGLVVKEGESIFSNSYKYYSLKLDIFCKNNSIKIREVRNIIELEYELKTSSLDLTLIKDSQHPKISLFELEKLYPGSVNKDLLDTEKRNLDIYRNINQEHSSNDDEIEEDMDDESDLKTQLKFKSEVYEKLKKITKVPKDYNLALKFCQKWKKIVAESDKKPDKIKQMCLHLEYLLTKFENKEIQRDTLNDYFYIIFTFCFDILVEAKNIEQAICDIDTKIKNSNLNPNVQKKYDARVRLFFNKEYDFSYERIKSVINYNRSIVFSDELDSLIKRLILEDQKAVKNKLLTSSRAVYTILAYYTGLRKGELYSRFLKDMYYVEDKKFYISVNNKGVKLINKKNNSSIVSLKNHNAKRDFEFEISNSKHFKIVKDYFDQLKNYKVKFLFPGVNKNNNISRFNVIKIKKINEINTILQDITNRYTVIHSFRHTYVTTEINKMLNSKSQLEGIFDLIYRVGHSDPEITLKFYAHLDLYYLIN